MVKDVIAILFCGMGTVFFIVGTTGLLRLPDLYARIHACTKCDTLGGCSVLVGLAVYAGFSFAALKLLLVAMFLLLSSATCGHAIGRSAWLRGVPVGRKARRPGDEGEETA
jgi:multicomponent Na+:H+ antiporter subunit G